MSAPHQVPMTARRPDPGHDDLQGWSHPEDVAGRAEYERYRQHMRVELERDQAALLAALADLGVRTGSVWFLPEMPEAYPRVIPVLVEHLGIPHHPRIREGIVRALGVRAARGIGWGPLLREFEVQPVDRAGDRSVKDALGFALSEVAEPRHLEELQRLVRDPAHGESRLPLLLALERIGDDRTVALLEELERDAFFSAESRRSRIRLQSRLSRRRARRRRSRRSG